MDGPVTIASFTRPPAEEEHESKFCIHMAELREILMKPEVKDLPACVYAIVGPYRMGKSFTMNYIMRHVKAKAENGKVSSSLGDENEELKGFSWKRGSEPDTDGIVMWGRPLILTRKSNMGKVAVILVDNQGLFDSQLNETAEDLLFAVNAIISKTLIYNIFKQIDENCLRALQRAVEATSPEENGKLLQETVLITLVRDWFAGDVLGLNGGKEELKKVLERGKSKKLRETRAIFESAFQELQCYLMPFIGNIAAKARGAFNGSLKDLDPDFKKHLEELVEHLLSENLLKPKHIAGQPMTCEDVYRALAIFNHKVLFSNGKPPASNEAFQQIELDKMVRLCEHQYKQQMDKIFAKGKPHLPKEEFDKMNEEFTKDALENLKEISNDEATGQEAEKRIRYLYEYYSIQNDANSTDKKLRGVALAIKAYEGQMIGALGDWKTMTDEEFNEQQRLAKDIALETYDKNVPVTAAQMTEGREEVANHCNRNAEKYREKNYYYSMVKGGAKVLGRVVVFSAKVGNFLIMQMGTSIAGQAIQTRAAAAAMPVVAAAAESTLAMLRSILG